jgi:hypothetical protein
MSQPMVPPRLFCQFRVASISLRDVAKLVPELSLNSQLLRIHPVELNPEKQMTMESCRFRDFVVPLLGLWTRHPSIHEMRATRLVDSSFRAPHLPDDAGTRLCLGHTILRSILDRFARPLSARSQLGALRSPGLRSETKTLASIRRIMAFRTRPLTSYLRRG